MNKQDLIRDLIDKFDLASPVLAQTQDDMLDAKEALATAEYNHKYALIMARANAQGKNADQREAEALLDDEVEERAQQLFEAQQVFNAAYRDFKDAEARIAHLRDLAGLVKELE